MGFNDRSYFTSKFWRENRVCDCFRTYIGFHDGNIGHSLGGSTSKRTDASDHECVGFFNFFKINPYHTHWFVGEDAFLNNPLNVILVNHFCLLETFIITIFFMAVDRETKTVPIWIQKGISRLENCFKKQKIENTEEWLQLFQQEVAKFCFLSFLWIIKSTTAGN